VGGAASQALMGKWAPTENRQHQLRRRGQPKSQKTGRGKKERANHKHSAPKSQLGREPPCRGISPLNSEDGGRLKEFHFREKGGTQYRSVNFKNICSRGPNASTKMPRGKSFKMSGYGGEVLFLCGGGDLWVGVAYNYGLLV